MKLFLTSKFACVGEKIAEMISPTQMKVVFIDTAAQPYVSKSADATWINKDRNKLVELGFNVTDLDINGKSEQDLRIVLDQADIIFVAGGNVNYLLKKSMESGFAYLANEYVQKGKIYIGSSAGSILAGPTTEPFWGGEKEDLPVNFTMSTFSALQLVDFVILPHYERPEYQEEFDKIIERFEKKLALRKLSDTQVIIIDGDHESMVSV